MKLRSARVKSSDSPRQMRWWCSFTIISVDWLGCPMYTCLCSQVMFLHPQSLQSLTVLNKGNEAGDLGWEANIFNVSRQHSADVVEGRVDL